MLQHCSRSRNIAVKMTERKHYSQHNEKLCYVLCTLVLKPRVNCEVCTMQHLILVDMQKYLQMPEIYHYHL